MIIQCNDKYFDKEVENEYIQLTQKIKSVCKDCVEPNLVSQVYGRTLEEKYRIYKCQRLILKCLKDFSESYFDKGLKNYEVVDKFNECLYHRRDDKPLCQKFVQDKFFKKRERKEVDVNINIDANDTLQTKMQIQLPNVDEINGDILISPRVKIVQAYCQEYTDNETRQYCSLALEGYLFGKYNFNQYVNIIKSLIDNNEVNDALDDILLRIQGINR
ncbi:MAG: hypothetical protein QXO37_06990 [Candidatus Nitrosocaldaceae archaeon]